MTTKLAVALLLVSSPIVFSQEVQLPPRPTCTPLFSGGACQSLWNQYNAAVAQAQQSNYQERVKQWADQQNSQKAAMQQTIERLTEENSSQANRITNLNAQIAQDATRSRMATDKLVDDSFAEGIVIGAGGVLLLVGLSWLIRKFRDGYTLVRNDSQSRAENL